MPEAHPAYEEAAARIPRTLFAHAHQDDDINWPADLTFQADVLAFTLTPDNWNGLDNLILWLLGGATEAITLDVTINIGTCNEAFNVHTQTVAAIGANMVVNEYECIDLTATFAVVLANLAARDIIQVVVSRETGDGPHDYIGIELQET